MKVNVTSSSDCLTSKIIEASSIDEAIKKIQNDVDLINFVTDKRYSELYNDRKDYSKSNPEIPTQFVISTIKRENYDVDIEIYDTYRE